MAPGTIPATFDEAVALGFEVAEEDEFRAALEHLATRPQNEIENWSMPLVDCTVASQGTVCTYIPCYQGYEYISTCYNKVCKPSLKRRC